MIIQCVKCSKKFQVNSELIPNEGRTIQCGSCGHLWFFVKKDLISQKTSKIEIDPKIEDLKKARQYIDLILEKETQSEIKMKLGK